MFEIPLEACVPHGSVLCENAKCCCGHCKVLSCVAVRTCNSRSFPCVDEDSGSEEETLQYFSAVDPNYRSRRKKKLDSQNKNSQSFLSVLLSINHGLMAVFTDVKVCCALSYNEVGEGGLLWGMDAVVQDGRDCSCSGSSFLCSSKAVWPPCRKHELILPVRAVVVTFIFLILKEGEAQVFVTEDLHSTHIMQCFASLYRWLRNQTALCGVEGFLS